MATSRTARAAIAQRGSSSKFQQTAAPARIVSRSTIGSSSAPMRLYWPVARATNPSRRSPSAIARKISDAAVSRPSPESKAMTRKTGIAASRT